MMNSKLGNICKRLAFVLYFSAFLKAMLTNGKQ